MCQTIKEIETNMAYRWFLDFGFHTEVPHFSTFGKNCESRYHDSDVFEQIFYHILKEIMDHGLLHSDHIFIDSTHS
jgi:transposase